MYRPYFSVTSVVHLPSCMSCPLPLPSPPIILLLSLLIGQNIGHIFIRLCYICSPPSLHCVFCPLFLPSLPAFFLLSRLIGQYRGHIFLRYCYICSPPSFFHVFVIYTIALYYFLCYPSYNLQYIGRVFLSFCHVCSPPSLFFISPSTTANSYFFMLSLLKPSIQMPYFH